jgi:hypothetical protein
MLSVSALFTPISEDEVFESFLATLETLSIPARSWRKGGAYRNILRAVSRTYAGLTVVMSDFAKAGFLDDSSGGWLTLLAHFVYGVDRPPATFALGKLLFTNVGGGVYDSSNAAAGTVFALWTDGNKTYVTLEDLNLLNPGDTQLVPIRAVEIGSASSVAPTLINALQTNLLGVEVSNPLSVVGSDAMPDELLRQLCRDKLAALSPLGARGAYDYAVAIAKRLDGSPVDINRHRIISDPTTGTVTIICASPSGVPLDSDLDAVRLSVEENARPDSVTAVVLGAVPVAFSKTLTVWARAQAGVDAAAILADVDGALVTMVAVYPIGGERKYPATQGYLFATNIEGTAKAAHPTIFAIDGVGSDLAIDPDGVVTLAATVTVRIVT